MSILLQQEKVYLGDEIEEILDRDDKAFDKRSGWIANLLSRLRAYSNKQNHRGKYHEAGVLRRFHSQRKRR